MTAQLTIGIVAGEASGDALGADLIKKMNQKQPNIRWVGVGGDQMAQAGLQSLMDISRLSVMGLVEVIKHLPDLLRAKQEILTAFNEHDIDIFIGIDAPDFNLRLGKNLKTKGVFCVQYVSPSIWAWRENRIHTIKQATHLVLCLFPFELPVYQKHGHPAVCVGHPLLDQLNADHQASNQKTSHFIDRYQPYFKNLENLRVDQPIISIMAGSRQSEITAILPLLLQGMKNIAKQRPDCQFILPTINAEQAFLAGQICQEHLADSPIRPLIIHQIPKDHHLSISQAAMNISQVILLASGTATLEALLLERPMVVVYKVNRLTYAIAKKLIKTPYVSLPNILSYQQSKQAIVSELIQDQATTEAISHQALDILDNPEAHTQKLTQTVAILRQDSHHNPACAILTHYQESCHVSKQSNQ